MFELSKKELKALRVKTITERLYSLKSGEVSNNFNEVRIFEFDEEGNNIYQKSELYESEFDYDQFGNVIKHIYSGGHINYINKFEIDYDDKGLKIEERINQVFTNKRTKITYKYDSQGLLIEESTFNENYGAIEDMRKYLYDQTGNMVTEILKGNDFCPEMKIYNEYDNRRNKIKSIAYNEDGSIQVTWKYKYDDKNRIIEDSSERNDFSGNNKYVLNYQDNGLLLEKIQYHNSNEPESIYKYEYVLFGD